MYDGILNLALAIPIRLEDTEGADVTGKTNADLVVQKADKDDASWVTVAEGSRSLSELGGGDYRLTIVVAVIDTLGFFRVKVACSGCVTKQYVANIKLSNFSDGAVHCDKTAGLAGAVYPVGTRTRPANTLQNALDIAETNKVGHVKVKLQGNETVADSGNRLRYKTIEGLISPFRKTTIGILSFSGAPANLQGSLFKKMKINFSGEGQGVQFQECYIKTGFQSDDYSMQRCVLEADLATSGFADLLGCHFLGGDIEVLSIAAGDGFNMAGCFGKITIKNMDHANNFINLDGFFGDIEIDNTCTAGTINIRGGAGKLTIGGSVTATVNEDGFNTNGAALTAQQARDAMKLAPTGGAPAAGSVDKHLDDILEDTNETQSKLPFGTITKAGDAMDVIAEIKHKAGASGYNRLTDSFEAIGERTQAIPDKAKVKDIFLNRNVTQRHPAGPGEDKPKTVLIGAGGAEGTVATTIDGDGNLVQEVLS